MAEIKEIKFAQKQFFLMRPNPRFATLRAQSLSDTRREGFFIFAAIAEFERELIRQRVKSGLAAAKANGKRLGRPRVYAPADKIAALRATGTPWGKICASLNLSRGSAQRAFYGLSHTTGGLEAQP